MSPQHDYIIDNSTGANVRSDINSVLQAISSTNSGSSAPSTTYAFQLFANTTTSKLQIRNSANNAFVDLLGLDGSIALPDGSVSAPSLGFADDSNTGLFSSAADTLNFTTGGVERMELGATTIFNEDGADVDFRVEGDTDANLLFVDASADKIGIGTSGLTGKFNIQGAAGAVALQTTDATNSTFQISHLSSSLTLLSGGGSQNLGFGIGGAEKMRIDSSGSVLVGATSYGGGGDAPDLYISSTGGRQVKIHNPNSSTSSLQLTNAATGQGNDNGLQIAMLADQTAYINQVESAPIRIDVNGSERMRIDSSGDVLIGTTTAVVDTKLVVAGNINQFNPDTGTGASTKSYVLGRSYTMSTSSTNILTFDNWGTSAFDITVFRRDSASPAGAAVHKVYLAFKGSGTNMTQAAIAQEHKVAISGIHGITFSVSENNDTATLIVTGDDNGGETQDFTIYIMARGNGNGTIVVA